VCGFESRPPHASVAPCVEATCEVNARVARRGRSGDRDCLDRSGLGSGSSDLDYYGAADQSGDAVSGITDDGHRCLARFYPPS